MQDLAAPKIEQATEKLSPISFSHVHLADRDKSGFNLRSRFYCIL